MFETAYLFFKYIQINWKKGVIVATCDLYPQIKMSVRHEIFHV